MARGLGSLLWLSFSGGEVFLREDIGEITRIFYRHSRPSMILFSSNGLLPGKIRKEMEGILKDSPESRITLKLSLDGFEETHDRIRGVPGAYRRVMETLHLLTPLLENYPNFELGINTVFCGENQDEVPALIDKLKVMAGVRTHTVSLVRGEGLAKVDPEKYRKTVEKLERQILRGQAQRYAFRGARLKAAQDILQRRLILKTIDERRQVIPCLAGSLTLVVREEGSVYPCENFGLFMGNLRDHDCDLKGLLATEQAREVIKGIKEGRCHCSHECYLMMSILFNPSCYPALFREYVRCLFHGGR
ncbi:MAG: radical SAM/SPASM domain-containing protein [Nitrospirae bacterium]|nr:MAG: radical SAM/SPASM domain-containing protein [Nitrospirota bacterium]